MIALKRFAAGSYTDQEITDFINTKSIQRDKYLENGDILFLYSEFEDIGMDAATKLERLAKSVLQAETERFDAEQDLLEVNGDLADVEDQISQANPNDAVWDALQQQLKQVKDRLNMTRQTIDGRTKQVFDLRTAHAAALTTLTKPK